MTPRRLEPLSAPSLLPARSAPLPIKRDVPGEPLAPGVRSSFESRLNQDLGHVRVHRGDQAARSAAALGAQAYTVGSHIVFGSGRFDPQSSAGQVLLAHELIHTLQPAPAGGHSRDSAIGVLRSPDPQAADPAAAPVPDAQASPTVHVVKGRPKAILLDPDRAFVPVRVGLTTAKTQLRDPADLSVVRVDLLGDALHPPLDIEVTIEDERVQGKSRYYLVSWEHEAAWVRSTELATVHDAVVPDGTALDLGEVLKSGKTEVTHVAWQGQSGWIASQHIAQYDLRGTIFTDDGRMATTLLLPTPDAPASTDANKQSKPDFAKRVPRSFISAAEVERLGRIIGTVNNDKAYERDAASGASLAPQRIEPGAHVIVLERRQVTVNGAEVVVARVIGFDGVTHWTALANLSMRSLATQDEAGNPNGSLLDGIEHPAVLAALHEVYGQQVADLLQSKDHDPMQAELLEQARAFVASPDLQGTLPEIPMPDYVKVEDGISLNPDLIDRLNRYYRFLLHADLVFRPIEPYEMSGVRSYARAHELAMFFLLNPEQRHLATPESQLAFAQQIVAIGGLDSHTPQERQWASEVEVAALRDALQELASAPAPVLESDPTEAASVECPLVSDAASLVDPEVPAECLPGPAERIERVIKAIQSRHQRVLEGEKNPLFQGSVAAEGYATGDPRRGADIRETGISNHCGGEAMDIHFAYRFNYYDPLIDAIAMIFGLRRPAKDRGREYWHYERIGVPLGEREVGDGLEP